MSREVKQNSNQANMSSYMAESCFVAEPIIRFFPTQGCGSKCKAVWGRRDVTECQHGVRRSPQCGRECREALNNGKLCPHATVFCSLCSESRWPEHACYCFGDKIDKKTGWVFTVVRLHQTKASFAHRCFVNSSLGF